MSWASVPGPAGATRAPLPFATGTPSTGALSVEGDGPASPSSSHHGSGACSGSGAASGARDGADRLRSPVRPTPTDIDECLPTEVKHGQAFCQLIEAIPGKSLPKAGGCGATIVVTMTLEQLLADLEAAGVCTLDTGGHLAAAEARRLACAAGIIPAVLGGRSQPLDLGRRRRLHTEAQRLAMDLRDHGCTTVGCDRPPAMCHAHHDHPGPTAATPTSKTGRLLCGHHHPPHPRPPLRKLTDYPNGKSAFHRRNLGVSPQRHDPRLNLDHNDRSRWHCSKANRTRRGTPTATNKRTSTTSIENRSPADQTPPSGFDKLNRHESTQATTGHGCGLDYPLASLAARPPKTAQKTGAQLETDPVSTQIDRVDRHVAGRRRRVRMSPVLVELLPGRDAAEVEGDERDQGAGDVVGDVVPAEVGRREHA